MAIGFGKVSEIVQIRLTGYGKKFKKENITGLALRVSIYSIVKPFENAFFSLEDQAFRTAPGVRISSKGMPGGIPPFRSPFAGS